MNFTVYTSFTNIPDFESGVAIQCFPERHSAHDVKVTFDSSQVLILSNQTGLYIQKKPKKKIFKWFQKKSV